MLYIIFTVLLIWGVFKLTGFIFKIFGKVIGGIFSLVGYLLVGALAIAGFGITLALIPVLIIVCITTIALCAGSV